MERNKGLGPVVIPPSPLTPKEVMQFRHRFGLNKVPTAKRKPWYYILLLAIVHPFNVLLILLALSSALTEGYHTMGILIIMVFLSSVIRFSQEWKSYREAQGLLSMISRKVKVVRFESENKEWDSKEYELNTDELVPGDWVKLEPGNIIPADLLILKSTELYVSQASLTGEPIPVEKYPSDGQFEGGITIPVRNLEFKIPNDVRNVRKKRKFLFNNIIRSAFGIQRKNCTFAPSDAEKLEMKSHLERPEMCFMGTSVVTGAATALVLSTGRQTYFGKMATHIVNQAPQNAFQLGVRRISWIFFLTMVLMIPPVFVLQGYIENKWDKAAIFALSVAVGLTPEMLPMIVNATLSKGAYQLARKKCVVKCLDAVVNLGGMDILCTDKTGTLTQSVVTLSKFVNPFGEYSVIPLHFAYLNSCYQPVHNNPMDAAVLLFYDTFQFQGRTSVSITSSLINPPNISQFYDKIGDIPFDFNRRRTSVILRNNLTEVNSLILICKGATDEILSVCTQMFSDINNTNRPIDFKIPDDSNIKALTQDLLSQLKEENKKLSEQGLRVLAVSYKKISQDQSTFSISDENDMIFVGFIAFLDPPKTSSKPAIQALLKNGVAIKILTGDSSVVCNKICQEIELPVQNIVTSTDLDGLNEVQISQLAERSTIFSKLTPIQKSDIVRSLRRSGHIVGFLGDGINDSPALVEADVGISVDSGTDIAKDSADIILLEKDLGVVGEGVIIGRASFGNTIKYIMMAVSSNFGNVFSVLVASAWLDFPPMDPIHLLVQNLLYDISQIAIPWDKMDPEFLAVPHKWSMISVLRFMVWMGPWSSVFDITTFLFLYFYFDIKTEDKDVKLFQTTWFTVGLLTQTLIVHMIRSTKIPFFQSRASFPLSISTILIMGCGLAVPFIPLRALKMKRLTKDIYPWIAGTLLCYAFAAQMAKMIYIKIFHMWF